MEITTTLICGDEYETSVFVTSYSDDLSILFSFPFELIVWRISHESSYREYVESLMPSELVQSSLTLDSRPTLVSLESLRFFAVLGGRGDTTIVHLKGGTESKTTYVYK